MYVYEGQIRGRIACIRVWGGARFRTAGRKEKMAMACIPGESSSPAKTCLVKGRGGRTVVATGNGEKEREDGDRQHRTAQQLMAQGPPHKRSSPLQSRTVGAQGATVFKFVVRPFLD